MIFIFDTKFYGSNTCYIKDYNDIIKVGKNSTALRCGSFSEKASKNSTCTVIIRIIINLQSNISVINFIVGFSNMSKVPRNMSL